MAEVTDRELLELAAKAHGFIDDQTSDDDGDGDQIGLHRNGQGIYYVVHKFGWHNWTPVINDGDAMRLAAKLKIDIDWQDTKSFPEPMVEAYRSNGDEGSYCASEHEDDYRRAIVRAAAEIGRGMP